MSGSGGGGGGGDFDVPIADCSRLAFDTHIASPQAPVVKTLKVGDVLDVDLATVNNTRVVVAKTANGDVVGGIVAPQLQKLRECLENGTAFKADVREIKNGQIKVRVEAK